MAAYTEAKKASNQKWDAANLDRLSLAIPKGQKEAIKDHTTAQGESVNGFIWRAIQEAMERDKAKEGQQRPQEGPEEAQAAAQESPSAAPAQEEATKPPCPLPYLWDGADMEQIASNCLSALDDIGYTVGEIADLLLTLSLLGHGNEYHPAGGATIGGTTLGGCFSLLWEMVDGARTDINELGTQALAAMTQEQERRRGHSEQRAEAGH